jgi:hypothetical protein
VKRRVTVEAVVTPEAAERLAMVEAVVTPEAVAAVGRVRPVSA